VQKVQWVPNHLVMLGLCFKSYLPSLGHTAIDEVLLHPTIDVLHAVS